MMHRPLLVAVLAATAGPCFAAVTAEPTKEQAAFFEKEKILFSLGDKVVVTPHLGASTNEAQTVASTDVVAGPLPKPAADAMKACNEQPWPYSNCVGTQFGNPNVRLIAIDRAS